MDIGIGHYLTVAAALFTLMPLIQTRLAPIRRGERLSLDNHSMVRHAGTC